MAKDWRESIQSLCELEPLSEDERNDYYATIGEMLENGMDEDDAAYLIFGPDVALEAITRLAS